jgi:hypothetical protein
MSDAPQIPNSEPWFYLITLELETQSSKTNVTYSGTINVGPKATPHEIYLAVRAAAEKGVRDQGGRDMARALTIFYHVEPNRPVG